MAVAFEQGDAEVGFKLGDPSADAGLRQIELLGRTGEVPVTERRFERNERGERREQTIKVCHLITVCQVA